VGVWQFSQAIFNGPCGFWDAAIELPTVPSAVTRAVPAHKRATHKSPHPHFLVDVPDKGTLFQSLCNDPSWSRCLVGYSVIAEARAASSSAASHASDADRERLQLV
jgi:hypothetical protein